MLSSGLDARQDDDALLGMLWKYKANMAGFTRCSLRSLGNLMLGDEVIAEYLSQLPAPTYRQGRYLDWVQPYLRQQLTESEQYTAPGTKEFQETLTQILSMF